MTETDDPFGDASTDGIPRDRWDRPMLIPAVYAAEKLYLNAQHNLQEVQDR